MPTFSNLIRVTTPAQVEPLANVCSRAFINELFMHYLLPGYNQRNNLPFIYQYFLRMCLSGGYEVYTTSEKYEGIAAWLSSDTKEPYGAIFRGGNPFTALKCGLRYVIWEINSSNRCSAIRKKLLPEPHMYLGLLAVDPVYQGKGYAGALLTPMLNRLDDQGLPCYVETHSLKNVSLYQYFGFKVVQEIGLPRVPSPSYAMIRRCQLLY